MPVSLFKYQRLLWEGILMTFFVSVFSSCSLSRKSGGLMITKESYCNPPLNTGEFKRTISSNTDSVLNANIALRAKFSIPAILLMHGLDILDDVKNIEVLKKDSSNSIKLLQLRQHIADKVLLANSEIDAIAAELDCEGERIDQIAKYIDDINAKRTTRFTVASIITG